MKLKKGVLLLVILLSLSGCFSGEGMVGLQEEGGSSHYSVGYLRFTGNYEISFTLVQDQKINVGVLSTKGTLDVEVLHLSEEGKETSVYTGEDLPTGNWNLELPAGRYLLRMTGKKHMGSLTLRY